MTDVVNLRDFEFPIELRDAMRDDVEFLRTMAHTAVFRMVGQDIPEAEMPSVEEAMTVHGLSEYVEGWGREGDHGTIASVNGEDIAAVWRRKYDRGEGVPEYERSIAIKGEYRGRSLGTLLAKREMSIAYDDGIKVMSVQIHRDNKVWCKLVEKQGFKPIREEDEHGYTLMAAPTEPFAAAK